MKLSIIVCTFNSEMLLPFTLDSILTQSYKDFEVVIIDGASTDGTVEVIKEYEKKFAGKLKFISEKDSGIYDAMNKGIKVASGEWLYFLGSDDVLFDNKVLESVIDNLNSENLDVVCGNVMLKNSNIVYHVKLSLIQILERGIHHQAIFCRRNLFEKFGNFNVKYRGVADWEFNMRWYNHHDIKRLKIERVIALYNENGFSNDFQDKQFQADKNGLIKEHFSFTIYLLYKVKFFVLLDIIEKAIELFKKEGLTSFLISAYKFVVFGRVYFRNRK